jgi:hypothetical protein
MKAVIWWPKPLLIEQGIDFDNAANENNIEFTHVAFDFDYLVH